MKNTTKKILSMLLAAIMLLSVMPVAYAERATYSPEVEEFIETKIKLDAYLIENRFSYEGINYGDTAFVDLIRTPGYAEELCIAWYQASEEWDSYDDGSFDIYIGGWDDYLYDKLNDEAYLEVFSVFNDIFKPIIDMTEELIESGKLVWVIDYCEFLKAYHSLYSYYDIYSLDVKPGYPAKDEYVQLIEEGGKGAQELVNYKEDTPVSEYDQAEFDVILKEKVVPCFDIIINCLDGNHPYGEYISNNDATEEADGTKTATCEFCGATDTVIDEGSKIDNNDNGKCSCNCHKSGIMGIIWKILNFFYRIFGMNKTCSCGVSHY